MDAQKQTIVILTQGGSGDVLAATPMIRGFRKDYPDDDIVVVSTYSQLLEHNPNIDILVPLKDPKDFYSEYVIKRKVRFFKKHFVYDHIVDEPAKGCTSLPEFICNVYGTQYDNKPPDYFITDYEKRSAKIFMEQADKKKKVLVHAFGATPSDGGYQQMLCGVCGGRGVDPQGNRCKNCGGSGRLALLEKTNSLKDADPEILTKLIDKYKDKIDFIQIGLEGEPVIRGAIDCLGMSMRETAALIPACDSFIFIESIFAHIAGALGKPGVVLFFNTSPFFFGYPSAHKVYNEATKCSLWPCNRPVGALMDFLPGYRNPKTKQKLLWECPDQVCKKDVTFEMIEEALMKSLDDGKPRKKGDDGHNTLESARKSVTKKSTKKKRGRPKKKKTSKKKDPSNDQPSS